MTKDSGQKDAEHPADIRGWGGEAQNPLELLLPFEKPANIQLTPT